MRRSDPFITDDDFEAVLKRLKVVGASGERWRTISSAPSARIQE